MSDPSGRTGIWLPWLELAGAGGAALLWFAAPQLGAWPLVLALLPRALRLVRTGRLFRRTAYDWPFLLFLVTAGAAVWSAYDRDLAWERFWAMVSAVLLFYAFASALRDRPVQMGPVLTWVMAGTGAVLALYFLLTNDYTEQTPKLALLTALGQAIQVPFSALQGAYVPQINRVGGIMAFSLPFAVCVSFLAWQARRWLQLAAGLLVTLLILIVLALTTSRGAWLATGAALLLALCWLLLGRVLRERLHVRRVIFFGSLGLLFSIGLLAIGWSSAARALIPGLASAVGGAGPLSRILIYHSSLPLAQDYPIVGAGLGGFMMLHATYGLLIHVGFITHAHNLYLNVAIDQGLPALFSLFWMWTIFGLAVWRASGRDKLPLSLAAAAMALLIVIGHGLVDDSFYTSRTVPLMFLPLAFAVPELSRAPLLTGRARWLAPAAAGAALIFTAVVFARPLQSIWYANLAAVRQSQIELSVYRWPEWYLQDQVRRERDLQAPIEGFERALALDPANVSANRRLAMLELSLGEYEDALVHAQAAYDGASWDNVSRQLLGEALIVNGSVEAGAALWRQVNNRQGQLQAREAWYRYLDDDERLARIGTLLGRP